MHVHDQEWPDQATAQLFQGISGQQPPGAPAEGRNQIMGPPERTTEQRLSPLFLITLIAKKQ